jgi:hypothetical protein
MYQFSKSTLWRLGVCLAFIVCLSFLSGLFVGIGVGHVDTRDLKDAPVLRPDDNPSSGRAEPEGKMTEKELSPQQAFDHGESENEKVKAEVRMGFHPREEHLMAGDEGRAYALTAIPLELGVIRESGEIFEDDDRDVRSGFAIQVGAFRQQADARQWLDDMHERGYRGRIVAHVDGSGRPWHRVVIGHYEHYGQATAGAAVFESEEGLPVVIRKLDGRFPRR